MNTRKIIAIILLIISVLIFFKYLDMMVSSALSVYGVNLWTNTEVIFYSAVNIIYSAFMLITALLMISVSSVILTGD